MIQPVNDANNLASTLLSEKKTQSNPTVSLFGQVYAQNAAQFCGQDTAQTLASFLGGKVVDISDQWVGGSVGPMLEIDMGQGKMLNAGLLAERFIKYDLASAISMTEAETGTKINVQLPVASSPVEAQSAPVAAPSSSLAKDTVTKDSPEKIADAGRQFEGLMLGQILKAATEHETGGVLSGEGDPASSSVMELAQESFAKALAAGGGMGLSKSIVDSLSPKTA